MRVLVFIAGVEVLLFFVIVAKIRANERLLREIRNCNRDLSVALWLASQEKFLEAHAAARQWHARLQDLRQGRSAPKARSATSNRSEVRLH